MTFPEISEDETGIEANTKTVTLSALLLALVLLGAALVVLVNTSGRGHHLGSGAFHEPKKGEFQNCGSNAVVPARAKESWRKFGAITAEYALAIDRPHGDLFHA